MTSNNYQFNIPDTQEQILDFFQEQVTPSDIAPLRNKDVDGVMEHNDNDNVHYNYH